MIRISQFKLPIEAGKPQIERALRRELGISDQHPLSFEILRRSLDARRGHAFHYVYIIDVTLAKEDKVFDDPALMRTPIVRNGKQVTVGYCPDVWATWE